MVVCVCVWVVGGWVGRWLGGWVGGGVGGGGGGRESVETLKRNYKSSLSIMSDFM